MTTARMPVTTIEPDWSRVVTTPKGHIFAVVYPNGDGFSGNIFSDHKELIASTGSDSKIEVIARISEVIDLQIGFEEKQWQANRDQNSRADLH